MILDDIFEVSGFGELDVSERLQKYFTDRGYRIMGEGRDQMVFHKPGQRHVIKVIGQGEWDTERGDTIADYVRFFAANQANPHFPRVSPPREIDVEDEIYTIYRQELLQDLSDDEEERLLDWIQAFGDALGDQWHMGPGTVKAWLRNNPPPRSLPLRQVQGVYAAVSKLLRHYGDDLTGARRLDLGHAANFMQRGDGTIVVVDPIAYDEDYGQFSEATRRDVLRGMGVAAGASALPPQTLARALTPTATTASTPVGGWIWTRVGDRVDQRYLTGLVSSIIKIYKNLARDNGMDAPDITELQTKLNSVLRKHVPKMDQASDFAQWKRMMQDLNQALPLPQLPPDLPDPYEDFEAWERWQDEHGELSDEEMQRLESELTGREVLNSKLAALGKITRDANLGDTENYGYKVNHKIKTGEIRPVDYSKTGSAAAQAAQTVATQAPRGAIASTLGSAGAALRDLGSRARDYVTKKGIKTVAPKALSAPTTDAEFMRDLQNRIQKPQQAEKEPARN